MNASYSNRILQELAFNPIKNFIRLLNSDFSESFKCIPSWQLFSIKFSQHSVKIYLKFKIFFSQLILNNLEPIESDNFPGN